MQRIPPVNVGDRLELVTATGPAAGDDTGPYRLEYRAVSALTCPHCGKQHQVRNRTTVEARDLPYGDHPVHLKIEEGSAFCPSARKHLPCELPDREGLLTLALSRYLKRHFGEEPRRVLARRTGVSESTIRAVQMAPWPDAPPAPKRIDYLGVDDIYMLKGRYLVATDLSEQTIVALERVGTVVEGRASAIDMETFFQALPEAEVVTLDMHAEQLAAAKARWPGASLVIDKRHLLGIVDRDLLKLVSNLVFDQRAKSGDVIAAQQAVRSFGLKAYPYLALRALVLRRRRNLTPADHAAWTLLLLEGKGQLQSPSKQLWEAYQWREALYDVYDAALPKAVIRAGLERWHDRMESWRKQGREEPPTDAPFHATSWAIRRYWPQILNYAETGVTNATTELINGQIRAHLRRGHRYDPKTLIVLVNQGTASSRSGQMIPPVDLSPTTLIPLHPQVPGLSADGVSPPRTPKRRSRRSPQVVPELGPTVTWQSSTRNSRLLPPQASELRIALPIWRWLHSSVDNRRREGNRWLHRVMQHVEGSDEAPIWRLCCAGQIRGADGQGVTAAALERWRAVVHHRFVTEHPSGLGITERERQPRLRELHLNTVYDCCPAIHASLARAYENLTESSLVKLNSEDRRLMAFVESWHHFRSGTGAVRTAVLEARPWLSWPGEVAMHGLELTNVGLLLTDTPLAWGMHLEWFVSHHRVGAALQAAWKADRAQWQERFASAVRAVLQDS